jgi:acid phosphatase class B
MDTQEVIAIDGRDIQRLHLEPGDVLVYVYPRKMTAETIDRISHQLRKAFKADIPIVILDQGARLQVVNKNELET